MKTLFSVPLFLITCVLFATQGDAQDKKTDGEKPKLGALAPHPLDKTMEKATNTTALTNAILNDKLFQQAVKNAVKAKQDMEAAYKKNPNLRSSTPAQAAREAFLQTLREGNNVGANTPEEKKDK